jgi:GlcNAc-P-P-Und epimerase
MNARVLVTGGSGFIGTNLVDALRRDGADVLNLDVKPPQHPEHEVLWQECDVRDLSSTAAAFRAFQPDVVHHLAARTDLHGRTLRDYDSNVRGVESVIEAVRATPSVRRALFASSRMVCRTGYQPSAEDDYCPPNAYGESKVAGERLVRQAGLECEWLIPRPTSIWGPWFDIPYKDFFTAVDRGRFVHVRGHRVRKSFGYVGNTVHQLRRLAECEPAEVQGATLYMGDYPPVCVDEMAELMRGELGAPRIRTVPLAVLKPVALGGDLLKAVGWKEPPLTRFRLDNLLTQMVLDLSHLESVVGPLPYTVEQGVVETVGWLRAHDGAAGRRSVAAS